MKREQSRLGGVGRVCNPPTEPRGANLGQPTRQTDEAYRAVRRGGLTPWMDQIRSPWRPSGDCKHALRPFAMWQPLQSAWLDGWSRAIDLSLRYVKGARVIAGSQDIPVGLTPKDALWSRGKSILYRYRPAKAVAERRRTPLLLVYSLVNKPYLFDLRPGRSFVEYLLGQGFDVFLLDWGSPGPEDKGLGLDDYVTRYLPEAARALLKASGAERFSMLGYCLGAVQAALYAALYPESPLANLILLTAPLDFSTPEKSAFSAWMDERFLDVDHIVDTLGNIPPEMVELGGKMLKPVDNFWKTYTALFEKLDNEEAIEGWQALQRWIHEGVPFAGEAFRQWVTNFVRENRLIEGRLAMGGQQVDLSRIVCPVLNVVAEQDHIVPPSQSLSFLQKISSRDKTLSRIPAGHVGLMIGRSAKRGLWPEIASWLSARDQGAPATEAP